MRNSVIVGVDIGGSHITAALVDLEKRMIIQGSGQRSAVNSSDHADNILNSWCKVINDVADHVQVSKIQIGIAMPGPFDYEAGVSLIHDQEKYRTLYKMNIKKELAQRLGIQPEDIRFINDAAGFLQGEVFSGAARGGVHVIGLTLGTGLGSAFCENGIAKDAELWGSKFKEGIAEDYLSTRWFVNRYDELTGKQISGVKELMIAKSDQTVMQIFEEFGNNLAQFLIPLVKEQDADLVVLGGNIANAYAEFLPIVLKVFKENKLLVKVKIADLKEDAALIGAASCWEDNLNKQP